MDDDYLFTTSMGNHNSMNHSSKSMDGIRLVRSMALLYFFYPFEFCNLTSYSFYKKWEYVCTKLDHRVTVCAQ